MDKECGVECGMAQYLRRIRRNNGKSYERGYCSHSPKGKRCPYLDEKYSSLRQQLINNGVITPK